MHTPEQYAAPLWSAGGLSASCHVAGAERQAAPKALASMASYDEGEIVGVLAPEPIRRDRDGDEERDRGRERAPTADRSAHNCPRCCTFALLCSQEGLRLPGT
jgi:hypothetical protein